MEPKPVKVQAIPFKKPIKSLQHKLPNKRKLKDNRKLSNTKPKRECLNQEAQVPSKQCLEKVLVNFLVIINSYSYLLLCFTEYLNFTLFDKNIKFCVLGGIDGFLIY